MQFFWRHERQLFKLRLTTSKVQQVVSQAFDWTGFSYAEEHVIGMDTLALDHGMQMAANPTESLSSDIDNVGEALETETAYWRRQFNSQIKTSRVSF